MTKRKLVSLYAKGKRNPIIYSVPIEWDDRKTVSKMIDAFDAYAETDEGVEINVFGNYDDTSKMLRPEEPEVANKVDETTGWFLFRLYMPDSFLENVGIQVVGKKSLKNVHVIHLTHVEEYALDDESRPLVVKTVGNYHIVKQFALGTPGETESDIQKKIMYHRWDFVAKHGELKGNGYMGYNVLVIDKNKPHKYPDPTTNELFTTVEEAEAFIHSIQKYEFTGKHVKIKIPKHVRQKKKEVTTLYQIRALIDIPKHGVKAGDVGGWLESPQNLSYTEDAWVHKDARVLGISCVLGDAVVIGKSKIRGDSSIFGNVEIIGDCTIDNTEVNGDIVLGDSKIINSGIYGSVHIESTDLNDAFVNGSSLHSPGTAVLMKNCSFMGNGERLKINNKDGEKLEIKDVSVHFSDEAVYPTISGWGLIENVVGETVAGLNLSSNLLIQNLELIGNADLFNHIESKTLIIKGSNKNEKVVLEDGEFTLKDCELTGNVHLKGDLYATSLLARDFSFVENNTDEQFELQNVKMVEMAILKKNRNGTDAKNISLNGDTEIKL